MNPLVLRNIKGEGIASDKPFPGFDVSRWFPPAVGGIQVVIFGFNIFGFVIVDSFLVDRFANIVTNFMTGFATVKANHFEGVELDKS